MFSTKLFELSLLHLFKKFSSKYFPISNARFLSKFPYINLAKFQCLILTHLIYNYLNHSYLDLTNSLTLNSKNS